MGLFDSLKNDMDNKAVVDVNAVMKVLIESGVDVTALKVSVDGATVTLDGTIDSENNRDKAETSVLKIVGVDVVKNNIEVKKSGVNDPKTNDNDQKSDVSNDDETYYTVVSGDSLSGIAKKFYGSAGKYMVIFEANRDVWTSHGKKENPDVIFPGWKFRIPKL